MNLLLVRNTENNKREEKNMGPKKQKTKSKEIRRGSEKQFLPERNNTQGRGTRDPQIGY